MIVLIDGEHHPAAVADALQVVEKSSEIVAVAFCGGEEKVPPPVLADPVPHYGFELVRGADPESALLKALSVANAERVLDLSDEPMVPASVKLRLAEVARAGGAGFVQPDLSGFADPLRAPLPGIAVIGTGKRSGKTAVCGHLARLVAERGGAPAIVSMGRGGPAEPVVASPPIELADLTALARAGAHAASDYLEDAALSGVPTVGCRRVGIRADGRPAFTNFPVGVSIAAGLPGVDLLLFEGSGASIPPVRFDRSICVVGNAAQLAEPTGPERVRSADLVLAPAVEHATCAEVRSLAAGVVVEFTLDTRAAESPPDDARVASFTTGGPPPAGIDVVVHSTALARRSELAEDLERAFASGCDLVLTEIKAAGIDTVAVAAEERGVPVGFINNVPVAAGNDAGAEIDEYLFNVWKEAVGDRKS